MPDTKQPDSLDEILRNFAKRVESMPRGKTYGWDEEKAAIQALQDRKSYPWKKIQRHITYDIEVVNLDADPTGETTEYQTCYMLPKKWVDEQVEKLNTQLPPPTK